MAVKIINQTSTNLNDYRSSGKYYFGVEFVPKNVPIGTNGWLEVFSEVAINNSQSGTRVKQLWYRDGTPTSTDMDTYVRTYNNLDGWGVWHKFLTDKDIPIECNRISIANAELNKVYKHEVKFNQYYSKIPVISLSVASATPHQVFVGYSGLSATGFTINLIRTSGITSTSVSWMAIRRNHSFTIG